MKNSTGNTSTKYYIKEFNNAVIIWKGNEPFFRVGDNISVKNTMRISLLPNDIKDIREISEEEVINKIMELKIEYL